ncbi:MAG: hypothetical protein RL748_1792, partial [Pseudomonadota bacterium]
MKKQLLWLLMAASLNVFAASGKPLPQLKPLPEHSEAAIFSAEILSSGHYRTLPLDDAMSIKIFDRYFKSLDSEKILFTQADIDQFNNAQTS